MEHQAKKPRTGGFPSQHLNVLKKLRSSGRKKMGPNMTQSTPRLGMVRDGSWLWLYRKLVSRCFNCPRYLELLSHLTWQYYSWYSWGLESRTRSILLFCENYLCFVVSAVGIAQSIRSSLEHHVPSLPIKWPALTYAKVLPAIKHGLLRHPITLMIAVIDITEFLAIHI
jgi:hypothetical protein